MVGAFLGWGIGVYWSEIFPALQASLGPSQGFKFIRAVSDAEGVNESGLGKYVAPTALELPMPWHEWGYCLIFAEQVALFDFNLLFLAGVLLFHPASCCQTNLLDP